MNRLHGLDALRGIAAMLVVVHHTLWALADGGLRWAAIAIDTVDLGKLGVAIFFLISGFVIPFSLKNGLAAFGIGRAFRLLPALWLSILFCVALGARVEGLGHLLANAFMVTHLFGRLNISDPYWTLGWELYFYVVVALVCAAGWVKSPRTFGLLSMAFGLLAGTYDARFSYLVFMFVGTLLRMVLLDRNEAAGMWLRGSLTALVGLWFLWWLTGAKEMKFFLGLALALPAFLLLWDRFSHPALLWLGAVSYSLYLFHLPIIEALHRTALPMPVFATLAFALPLLVASLVHRWVELPAMKYGRLVASRLNRVSRPAEASAGVS